LQVEMLSSARNGFPIGSRLPWPPNSSGSAAA